VKLPAERLAARWLRLRLPRRSIRLRLTLLYGGLILLSGAALLAITFLLVKRATVPERAKTIVRQGAIPNPLPRNLQQQVQLAVAHQHASDLNQLLIQSGIALAILAVIAVALGWLVAGRVLRPLSTITATARRLSASNLHERLALQGPDDELKDLGDTLDELLDRLEASFVAQRQFVANASHELRTPLTLQRTLVQVALAGLDADADSLREMGEEVLATGERQERLIEALLTLSRSQGGLDRREPVDLAAIAAETLQDVDTDGLTVDVAIELARTVGDPDLTERLVANLLENAARHNLPNGRIELATRTVAGRAVLTVANTGPMIAPGDVERIFQPFQRLHGQRTNSADGFGLGLAIVDAIATAHDALVTARPQPDGGLHIEVSFPAETPV
jgi:signal transduction histidine kinase